MQTYSVAFRYTYMHIYRYTDIQIYRRVPRVTITRSSTGWKARWRTSPLENHEDKVRDLVARSNARMAVADDGAK